MKKLINLAEEISADCTNGSSVLARRFIERLVEGNFTPDEYENSVRMILEAHPDMAILKHSARVLQKVPFDRLPSAAQEFLKSLERAPEKIAEHLINILPQNAQVMTYSRSGTVHTSLLLAHKSGKLGGVVLSEGRPDFEGKKFAEELALAGIETTLTTDCALSTLIEFVDVVLVGADAVTPEFIINKVGTLQVALAANYADKPIYSLASTHKFASTASPNKTYPSSKIWENPPEGIRIASPLFEKIPLALFNAVICERGQAGLQEIEMIVE
ncbi:hypothetical protein J7M00_04975 [bacterium]|nr:hypothetical protein [bacterium]